MARQNISTEQGISKRNTLTSWEAGCILSFMKDAFLGFGDISDSVTVNGNAFYGMGVLCRLLSDAAFQADEGASHE